MKEQAETPGDKSNSSNQLLITALRQYRHNDNKGGLLVGYDKETVDRIVATLLGENTRLKERERICPTMLEGEARALLRALQEIAEAVGLTSLNSPSETVAAVRKLTKAS